MGVLRSSPTPKGPEQAAWHISTLTRRNPRRYGNSEGAVLGVLQESTKPLTAYQIRDQIEERIGESHQCRSIGYCNA
jgi:hypothetical protein